MQLSSLLRSWPCWNPSGPLSRFFRGIRAGLLRISVLIVMHVLKTCKSPHFFKVWCLSLVFPGNNNLVLVSFLGGPPCQSLWKQFPDNNNLVLQPFLVGPPGQGLWMDFRGIPRYFALLSQASLIGVHLCIFDFRPLSSEPWLLSKVSMRFLTPTPRIPDKGSKRHFRLSTPYQASCRFWAKLLGLFDPDPTHL